MLLCVLAGDLGPDLEERIEMGVSGTVLLLDAF